MEKEDRIHIEIVILQQRIDLWIKKEHESYYRQAEKRINERAINFTKRWSYVDQQDLLSKLLIDAMVNYIAKEERLTAYESELLPKLEQLSELAENVNTTVSHLRIGASAEQKHPVD